MMLILRRTLAFLVDILLFAFVLLLTESIIALIVNFFSSSFRFVLGSELILLPLWFCVRDSSKLEFIFFGKRLSNIRIFSCKGESENKEAVSWKQIFTRNFVFFFFPIITSLIFGKIIGLDFWDFLKSTNYLKFKYIAFYIINISILIFIPFSVIFNRGYYGIHDIFSKTYYDHMVPSRHMPEVNKNRVFAAGFASLFLTSLSFFAIIICAQRQGGLANFTGQYDYFQKHFFSFNPNPNRTYSNVPEKMVNSFPIKPGSKIGFHKKGFLLGEPVSEWGGSEKIFRHLYEYSFGKSMLSFPVFLKNNEIVTTGTEYVNIELCVDRECFSSQKLKDRLLKEIVMMSKYYSPDTEWISVRILTGVRFDLVIAGWDEKYWIKRFLYYDEWALNVEKDFFANWDLRFVTSPISFSLYPPFVIYDESKQFLLRN